MFQNAKPKFPSKFESMTATKRLLFVGATLLSSALHSANSGQISTPDLSNQNSMNDQAKHLLESIDKMIMKDSKQKKK